jgi:monoamine oxidase
MAITPQPQLPSKVDVVVIGAGAAGLGAAKRLSEAHPPIAFVILEARDRVPGGGGGGGGRPPPSP